jgi:alpha-galactosidase
VNGFRLVDTTLLPGESLPLPGCLVGLYRGDWTDGCNALRRTIAEHYLPKLNGAAVIPPVFYDHFFMLGVDCGEARMRPQAEVAAQIGCEYFVLDAGWHRGSLANGFDFARNLGDWEPDPVKYPRGLKALAEYVRSLGMKFGLWIEPERCHAESSLAKAHPDWVVPKQGNPFCLVDFGNPEVVAWAKETFGRLFREAGVEWTRFDFNMDPQPYLASRDADDRQGLALIRYCEGVQEFWDYLLREHPALLIEGCASGGRRMDLASLKRSHTYWCNDHTHHPDVSRTDIRANLIFPANYLNHVQGILNMKDPYPPYAFHSYMGGTFGITEDLLAWPERRKRDAARHIAVFKQCRHLLMHDFTPLFPYPATLDVWDGYQWHDPRSGEGVVMVFRPLSKESRQRVGLKWLDPGATYEFTDPYTRRTKRMSGKTLATSGLPIELKKPRSSLVLRYRSRP